MHEVGPERFQACLSSGAAASEPGARRVDQDYDPEKVHEIAHEITLLPTSMLQNEREAPIAGANRPGFPSGGHKPKQPKVTTPAK